MRAARGDGFYLCSDAGVSGRDRRQRSIKLKDDNLRNMMMKRSLENPRSKEYVIYGLAILCITAAIVAIFLGIYIEPRGEVHGSILTYFGISSAFCGSLLGISAHYSSEMGRFKAEIHKKLGINDETDE